MLEIGSMIGAGIFGHRELCERHPVRIFGSDRMLAGQGLFPQFSGSGSRLGKRAGLFITAGLVVVVANTVDLSATDDAMAVDCARRARRLTRW